MTRFLDALWAAFDRHRLARRLTLLWACSLITWVCVRVFSNLPLITGAVATALATVVGILGTVIGFYKWQRFKEDRGKKSQ